VSKIRTLGEQIRRARIEKGLTQKQLADLLNVHTISSRDTDYTILIWRKNLKKSFEKVLTVGGGHDTINNVSKINF